MPRENKGPQLKPNEKGYYEIHWTENGRSRRSSTRSKDYSFAQKVLANFILHGEQEAANDGALMVLDALGDRDVPGADYWHEHVVPRVVDKETQHYAYVKLKEHFGHLAVKDIMPDHVDAYVAARRAGKIGRPSVNHTISRELSVLNAAINHAVKKRRLPKTDKPFIQLPGTSEPRDRWLTREEAMRFLTVALSHRGPHKDDGKLPRIYRFLMLALNTGSRKSALLGLKREQVKLDGGYIELNPAGRAQTKKRRPKVPISDALRPMLERTLREIPDRPDAFLLDHDGDIRTAFKTARIDAELGSDVTPHTLRHTKATWMAQAGRPMFEIAGVLGDSVETVTKTYAHHHPDYLRGAVNAGGIAA